MKVLFISTGRRNKEITTSLKKFVNVKTLVRAGFFKKIFYILFYDCDAIHTDNAFMDSTLACLLGKIRNRKTTVLIRGYGDHLLRRKKGYNLIYRFVMSVTERISFRFLDHVFFISIYTKNKMLRKFKVNSWSIANNGINLPKKVKKINIKSYLLENYNIKLDEKDVVMMSCTNLKFFHKAKGIKLIKKSVRLLPKNVYLLILGSGKYLDEVKNNSPFNVIFLGFKKNVSSWLSSSDIFVYCSFLDAFPTVMLEAQAAGLPVVASNTEGIPETTKYSKIVKPNPKDFAKAIKPLVLSSRLRRKQGSLNKTWIKDRNWDWAVKKYINTWKNLISINKD